MEVAALEEVKLLGLWLGWVEEDDEGPFAGEATLRAEGAEGSCR